MASRRSRKTAKRIVQPVPWLVPAWERLTRAAQVLTARDHRQVNTVDVVRIGSLRYADEILGSESVPVASQAAVKEA